MQNILISSVIPEFSFQPFYETYYSGTETNSIKPNYSANVTGGKEWIFFDVIGDFVIPFFLTMAVSVPQWPHKFRGKDKFLQTTFSTSSKPSSFKSPQKPYVKP